MAIYADWLLANAVLACFDARHRGREVRRVHGAHVHDVHVSKFEQFSVAAAGGHRFAALYLSVRLSKDLSARLVRTCCYRGDGCSWAFD
jgi:hypothetical protein